MYLSAFVLYCFDSFWWWNVWNSSNSTPRVQTLVIIVICNDCLLSSFLIFCELEVENKHSSVAWSADSADRKVRGLNIEINWNIDEPSQYFCLTVQDIRLETSGQRWNWIGRVTKNKWKLFNRRWNVANADGRDLPWTERLTISVSFRCWPSKLSFRSAVERVWDEISLRATARNVGWNYVIQGSE